MYISTVRVFFPWKSLEIRSPSIWACIVSPDGLPRGLSGEELICQCRRQEAWVRSLGWEDPLEQEMATHSSILAWKIPWTETPDRLSSMESQRVRHD